MKAERDFIRKIRDHVGKPVPAFLRLGIGDDCAILRPRAGEELLVTTDFSIEGTHFRRYWHPAASVGHRCLARGLSDIAAMGGRPHVYFLSLGIPGVSGNDLPNRWLSAFLKGMFALAERSGVILAGGDTSTSPAGLVADITVMGTVRRGRAVMRSGAHADDNLYVTGSLGGSAAVLHRLMRDEALTTADVVNTNKDKQKANTRAPLAPARTKAVDSRHFFPEPRIAVGQAIARFATAMIDVSDGLSTDLSHLCEESRVSAEVDSAVLPLSLGATLHEALHGGDDYELLFTAPAKVRVPRQISGVPITRIGRILPADARNPMTLLAAGKPLPLPVRGWEHFRN